MFYPSQVEPVWTGFSRGTMVDLKIYHVLNQQYKFQPSDYFPNKFFNNTSLISLSSNNRICQTANGWSKRQILCMKWNVSTKNLILSHQFSRKNRGIESDEAQKYFTKKDTSIHQKVWSWPKVFHACWPWLTQVVSSAQKTLADASVNQKIIQESNIGHFDQKLGNKSACVT